MDYRDKVHDMNPLIYKNAQVILESCNQEVLHETVLNVINVLSYNAEGFPKCKAFNTIEAVKCYVEKLYIAEYL